MIYSNIKKICNERKTPIRRLEIDLELSSGSICKWDKHMPSVESVKKVADYLQVKIDDLLDEKKGE